MNTLTPQEINELFPVATAPANAIRQDGKVPTFTADEVLPCLLSSYEAVVTSRGAYEYRPTPEIDKALAAISRWMTDPQKKRGLILYGAHPGSGKTSSALAIMTCYARLSRVAAYPFEEELTELQGRSDYLYDQGGHQDERDSIAHRMDEIREIINTKIRPIPHDVNFTTAAKIADVVRGADPDYDAVEQYAHQETRLSVKYTTPAPILIIDDLGTEPTEIKQFGNSRLPLVDVLTRRYEKQLPTIVTSNLSDSGMAKIYGPRIVDRLNEMCEKVHFGGASFRV